jgi:hypothetical protein
MILISTGPDNSVFNGLSLLATKVGATTSVENGLSPAASQISLTVLLSETSNMVANMTTSPCRTSMFSSFLPGGWQATRWSRKATQKKLIRYFTLLS